MFDTLIKVRVDYLSASKANPRLARVHVNGSGSNLGVPDWAGEFSRFGLYCCDVRDRMDCDERAACEHAGEFGHTFCGWCDKHGKAMHKCGCGRFLNPVLAELERDILNAPIVCESGTCGVCDLCTLFT